MQYTPVAPVCHRCKTPLRWEESMKVGIAGEVRTREMDIYFCPTCEQLEARGTTEDVVNRRS